MTRAAFGKLLVATAMGLSMITAANAYTHEQEAMCTSDAFRFCASEIPDVQRVTACMMRNKSQLSAGCRAVMDADSQSSAATYQPAAGGSSKPMSLAPPKP